MIKIDFAWAISIFLFVSILIVIMHWIFYTYNRRDKRDVSGSQYIKQCPYCTYIFFDYEKSKVAVCPQCKSYFEEQGVQGEKQ